MKTPSKLSVLALSLLPALMACGVGVPDGDEGAASVGEQREGLAPISSGPIYATPAGDTAASVAVRNGLTLTLQTVLTWHTGSDGEALILRGSTGQTLTQVWGFIPDDSFGTSTQLGPKSFELVFDNPSDINTVISGNPFYLKLTTHDAQGDHDWSAQLYVAPQLVPPAGATTTRLALGTALTPTSVTTNPEGVVFRGTATTTVRPQWLSVSADSPPTLTQDKPHAWHFDWDFSEFESAATGHTVTASAKFGAETSVRKGTVEMRVSKVGLAPGDSPDDIYGFPVCDPAVEACLQALPAGTTDFGSCGAFFPVSVCQQQ